MRDLSRWFIVDIDIIVYMATIVYTIIGFGSKVSAITLSICVWLIRLIREIMLVTKMNQLSMS